ncbi:MAG: hypothetical protein WAW75_05010 [Gallionella sp.]
MAAGVFIFPDKTKLNFFEGATALLKTGSALYRLALVSSAWTPVPSTDEVWADVSANEIANGNGYTTGGGTLASVVLNQTSGVVKFTSAAFVWTASGAGIPAWRRGVVYYLGTLNGKVNPLVGYFLGDSTPADIPLTTSPNTLTITPHSSGILSAT